MFYSNQQFARTFWIVGACAVVILLIGLQSERLAAAAEPNRNPHEGTITGIVIEKQSTSITVKSDRGWAAVKYILNNSDSQSREVLKTIFTTNRVQLAYKRVGDSCQLVSIGKKRPTAKSTVTGEVVHNHGWWIEVKPQGGPCEGYAVRIPRDRKGEVQEEVARLQESDIVMIRFTTDATGHKIHSIWKTGKKAARQRQTALEAL